MFWKIFTKPEFLTKNFSMCMLRCLRFFISTISEVHEALMMDAMNMKLKTLNEISGGEDSHSCPGLGKSSHKRHVDSSGSK
jgi:hypothetical protein